MPVFRTMRKNQLQVIMGIHGKGRTIKLPKGNMEEDFYDFRVGTVFLNEISKPLTIKSVDKLDFVIVENFYESKDSNKSEKAGLREDTCTNASDRGPCVYAEHLDVNKKKPTDTPPHTHD